MRVLVIGEPCVDVIHKADGKVYHEHGGISYSVAAGGMLDDGIETIPVIGLSGEDRRYFESLFSQIASVNLNGIYDIEEPVRRVDLFYEDENNRWECSTEPVEPTPFERIEPFLPAEGIHLNLIAGNDITLDSLRKIRKASPDTHIHLDLHNIVMRRMTDGRRIRGPVAEYLEWTSHADTVQMNEEEAGVIDPGVKNDDELAAKVLASGPRALVITFADRGLSVFEHSGGKVIEHFFPSSWTEVVDPTGSGDVFGATFLHCLLLGKSLQAAAAGAIEMATLNVGAAGPAGLLKKKRMRTNV